MMGNCQLQLHVVAVGGATSSATKGGRTPVPAAPCRLSYNKRLLRVRTFYLSRPINVKLTMYPQYTTDMRTSVRMARNVLNLGLLPWPEENLVKLYSHTGFI